MLNSPSFTFFSPTPKGYTVPGTPWIFELSKGCRDSQKSPPDVHEHSEAEILEPSFLKISLLSVFYQQFVVF